MTDTPWPKEWLRTIPAVLPPSTDSGAYLYFMLCESPHGQVKIGYAKNLAHRLSNAQCGCPYHIRLVAFMYSEEPRADEARLHAMLVEERIRGEWFTLSPRLIRAIDAVRSGQRHQRRLSPEGSWMWRGIERDL